MSELGQNFGNVAEKYHRVRPPYSQTLLDRAQDALSEPRERFRLQRREPWDHAFAGPQFGPLHYERADDEQTVDVEGLLTLYSTTSSLAALSGDERAALFARVRPLLAGPYRLPLRHELTWTRLAR